MSERVPIPEDLLRLKPSHALDSVSMSQLARHGSAILRQLMTTAQAVAVKVQGQGAMVTVSQRQYDEMVELIRCLQEERAEDGFTQMLGQQFDRLVATMNRAGAGKATSEALFGEPAELDKTYQPGATEADR
jgi:hypothetical protein